MQKKLALLLAIAVAGIAACRQETKTVTPAKPAAAQPQSRGYSEPSTAGTGAQTETAAGAAVDVGAKMPAYTAGLLSGENFDVAKEQGNVVLLNLWATWCGPCRFEIPELEKMHHHYEKEGFKVVGVSLDESGVDAVREFATTQKMTYPIAVDAEGRLANIFQTNVIPTSVLIDRHGTIVWKKFGAVDMNDKSLQAALAAALKQSRG
jgi:peroxiredoxin